MFLEIFFLFQLFLFQNHMEGFNVVRFTPSKQILEKYLDGGVAIIDQIICSHAR